MRLGRVIGMTGGLRIRIRRWGWWRYGSLMGRRQGWWRAWGLGIRGAVRRLCGMISEGIAGVIAGVVGVG